MSLVLLHIGNWDAGSISPSFVLHQMQATCAYKIFPVVSTITVGPSRLNSGNGNGTHPFALG
eukprot:scaffold132_cov79-Skeletonema_dohrnii-CCMP3373.AAC.2